MTNHEECYAGRSTQARTQPVPGSFEPIRIFVPIASVALSLHGS